MTTEPKTQTKTKTCLLQVEVTFDPERTDPEALGGVLDRLLETVLSTPDLLDEHGNPTFAASTVVEPEAHVEGSEPPADDTLGKLFDAATDAEADKLAAIAIRAGLLWRCSCGWNNESNETTCGDCGKARPEAGVKP